MGIIFWVLLNHAATSTQFHQPPPSSIHLQPAHFNLHPPPSTSTELISASTQISTTPSTIFEPKYCTWLGNFPKFRSKNEKMSILTENWHTGYIGDVDSKSRLRLLKFSHKTRFWANLDPKIQSCLLCLKIGTHSISRMLIQNQDLDFWNFEPKIHFWANLGKRSQICLF